MGDFYWQYSVSIFLIPVVVYLCVYIIYLYPTIS